MKCNLYIMPDWVLAASRLTKMVLPVALAGKNVQQRDKIE